MDSILTRLEEMRTAKGDFMRRWEENDMRTFAFLLDDGSFHLPNAWRICETVTDDVVSDFDGSVQFVPRIDSRIQKEGLQYEYLSRIYNQVNKSIGIQKHRKIAIKDAIRHGFGVLFEGYVRTGDQDRFDYLVTEHVSCRDFFFDPSAFTFHDPQGIRGARDCIRRRWYTYTSFEQNFKNNELFRQKSVNKILDEYGRYAELRNKDADRKQKMKEGVFTSAKGETQEITDAASLLDENEFKTGLILVYEYWTKERQTLYCRGEVIYDEENPYGELPFVVYSPFMEAETLFPPSLIEVMTPMLKLKEILANLWYMNARLSSTPIIYAAQDTGLIAGQPLRPGVQTVELTQGQDIRQKIQEVRLGGVSDSLTTFMAFLDDELTKASSLDQRALNAKPSELATQTLQKVENELKSLRGMIDTMMIDAESQRAFLRAKNIIKFIFNNKRDVLLSDFTMTKDGKLKSAKDSIATVTINETEWEGLEYEVNVLSQKQHAFLEGQRRDDILRLLDTLMRYVQFDPTLQERIRMDVAIEEIMKTFDEIDTSKIFVQDKGVSEIQSEIEMVKRGKKADPTSQDQKGKEGKIRALMKSALGSKDQNEQRRLIQHLISANAQNPQEFSQNPVRTQNQQQPVGAPAQSA